MDTTTVIIPVYKVEPYLYRCVNSVLGQTHSDFELVLVDDGSPDGCGAICDEYAATNDRAIVVHQPNGGLSAARNVGIDWATACSDSKWLAFVDSDDWVHPCYLEYLHRAVEEQCTRLSVCEYAAVEAYTPSYWLSYGSELLPWDEFLVNSKNVRAVIACNKLYAKELFDGLRYPVGRIQEDEFLTYKLLHRAGYVALVASPLYSYYQSPHSIMRDRFSIKRLDAVYALAERVRYIHEEDILNMEEWSIRTFFAQCINVMDRLVGATWIPEEVRIDGMKRLRNQARLILVQCGWRHLSPRADYDCYSFAFPRLMLVVRAPAVAVKHLRSLRGRG